MRFDKPRANILSRESVARIHMMNGLIEINADRAQLSRQFDDFDTPFAVERRPHITGCAHHATQRFCGRQILCFAKGKKRSRLCFIDAETDESRLTPIVMSLVRHSSIVLSVRFAFRKLPSANMAGAASAHKDFVSQNPYPAIHHLFTLYSGKPSFSQRFSRHFADFKAVSKHSQRTITAVSPCS
nr:hypothetical protein [Methylocystis rosea]